MDIHLSVLTPYICCSIIQTGKTPPGKKGRMIKVIILIKIWFNSFSLILKLLISEVQQYVYHPQNDEYQ